MTTTAAGFSLLKFVHSFNIHGVTQVKYTLLDSSSRCKSERTSNIIEIHQPPCFFLSLSLPRAHVRAGNVRNGNIVLSERLSLSFLPLFLPARPCFLFGGPTVTSGNVRPPGSLFAHDDLRYQMLPVRGSRRPR